MSTADVLDGRALSLLARDGLLLMTDRALPSLVALVAGGPVRGSWWGHAEGHTIYALANRLAEHPDVLLLKLVAGKDTFVHRAHWSALLAVSLAREPWQLRNLSAAASILLDLVDEQGELRADDMPWIHAAPSTRSNVAARELERRLLVRSGQVHTEGGAHERLLESWAVWATRVGVAAGTQTASSAKKQLEKAASAYAARAGSAQPASFLPWPRA